ncbi:MAG: hypothetical protein AAFO69_16230 [Bacteroidota bacterium]
MRYLAIILAVATLFLQGCSGDSDASEVGANGGTSNGGSLAAITIVNNHLYALNPTSIIPVDITDLNDPEVLDLVYVGSGLETIFPYDGQLFLGSASAMFIYDLSDAERPQLQSFFSHATGCDPVVARGNYAYVTLRDGVSCNNPFNLNVLSVVDITNPRNTFLVSEYTLNNPRGLGIGCNNKLFVCDGEFGLRQYDLTDPSTPVLDTTYTSYFANDVLIKDDIVTMTGEDGIYQFLCEEDELRLLSTLPITR